MRVTTARRGFFAYIFIQSWVFRSGGRVQRGIMRLFPALWNSSLGACLRRL